MEDTDQKGSQKDNLVVGSAVEGVEPVFSRLEVVPGPTGRRYWSAAAKARIVAESYGSAVSVSAVARRHELRPNQLFLWRRLARQGKLALPATDDFVPALLASESAPASSVPEVGGIEIEVAGVVVRLAGGGALPARQIAELASALSAALRAGA